jgi:hypothetical protein
MGLKGPAPTAATLTGVTDPRATWRRGRAALGLLVVLTIVAIATAAGCGTGDGPDKQAKVTNAAIYAQVVAHSLDGADADKPPLVFVRPDPGQVIDLEIQAEVVRRLDDVAKIRFVDDADDVVLADEPFKPVRDQAMVVTVSDIQRTGSRAEVAVERYVDILHILDRCLALRRVAGEWTVDDDAKCTAEHA